MHGQQYIKILTFVPTPDSSHTICRNVGRLLEEGPFDTLWFHLFSVQS